MTSEIDPTEQTRTCRICGKSGPIRQTFYMDSEGVRGYKTACKGCLRPLARSRYVPVRIRNQKSNSTEK